MARSYLSDSGMQDLTTLAALNTIAARAVAGELTPIEAAEALRRLRQAAGLGSQVMDVTEELLLEGLSVQPKGDG